MIGQQRLGLGAEGFGFLMGCLGTGAVGVGLVIGRVRQRLALVRADAHARRAERQGQEPDRRPRQVEHPRSGSRLAAPEFERRPGLC